MKHLTIVSTLFLAACTQPVTFTVSPSHTANYQQGRDMSQQVPASFSPPDSAFRNPANISRLMDRSAEHVTIELSSSDSLAQLERLIADERPERVQITCGRTQVLCNRASSMLQAKAIPYNIVEGDDGSLTLMYQRHVARDCDSRFVDNTQNNHNLNHPAFGCALVANTIRMVGNKKQLTDPELMDLPDAEKAVQQRRRYSKPPMVTRPREGSVLKNIVTSD